MNRLAFAAFALCCCAVVQADALDDIMKMQKEGGGQNRWLRPCKAGEKPGLQGAG
jgi:hypothetical protein